MLKSDWSDGVNYGSESSSGCNMKDKLILMCKFE